MKKLIKTLFLANLVLIVLLTNVSCFKHEHNFSGWMVNSDPSCSNEGNKSRKCAKCGYIETEIISATGHSFGDWVYEDDKGFHSCSNCGLREYMYTNLPESGSSNDEWTPGDTQIIGEYANFDSFLASSSKSGDTVTYKGEYSSLIVNLVEGGHSCNGYTINIPQNVSSIKFIGRISGNPFYNVKIIIENRTNDIDISFNNVLIESSDTIFVSESRNINVNITLEGEKCSFIVAEKAHNGSPGKDKTSLEETTSGGRGADGAHAMKINGNVLFKCCSNVVDVRGGDAGDGGNGGSVQSGWFGSGGHGGDGGNGGNAVYGERLATVKILGFDCDVSFTGGRGGSGGSGGFKIGLAIANAYDGNPGRSGQDGGSGCLNFEYIQ